jgi:hypothetical protein
MGKHRKKHHKHKKLKLELLLSTDSSTSSSDDDEWEATAGQLALALAAAVGGETMAAMLGILPNQAGEPSQPSRLFFSIFYFFYMNCACLFHFMLEAATASCASPMPCKGCLWQLG